MRFWDTVFDNNSSNNRNNNRGGSSWGRSSSDYDSRGHYNPGAWREKYDRYNWEYHKSVCDHWDHYECDDDDHF